MNEDLDSPKVQSTLKWALLLVGLVLLLAGGLLIRSTRSADKAARTEADLTISKATLDGARALDERLTEMVDMVARVAEDLDRGGLEPDRSAPVRPPNADASVDPPAAPPCARVAGRDPGARDLAAALCNRAARAPWLNGIGVVFIDDELDHYRPYAARFEGDLKLHRLTPANDLPAVDWVDQALNRGPDWTGPRFGTTSNALLALYSQAFTLPDGTEGVVLGSYALDQLADDLRWFDPDLPGYSFVLDQDDRLISHPHARRVEQSVRQNRRLVGLPALTVTSAEQSQTSVLQVTDDLTENAALVATAAVDAADWRFATVVLSNDLPQSNDRHKSMMLAGGALILGVTCLGLAAIATRRPRVSLLWFASVWIMIGAVFSTMWVWNVAATLPQTSTSSISPADIVEDEPPSDGEDGPDGGPAIEDSQSDPLSVGVFVQSIEFTGANDVNVSGIVWQETRGADSENVPGLAFPEADQITVEEQFRGTDDGVLRVGWSFSASLRQEFDYSRYPFDQETVWVRLWPGDYDLGRLLIPDVTSYESLAPSTKPGVEPDIVVEGWDVVASSFSYGTLDLDTQFTPNGNVGETSSDLFFNVHLKRTFLDVLLSKLVVLTVVSGLLFGVLVVTRAGVQKKENAGFSTLSVLGYCASLFFVVIIAHNSLRSELAAQGIIYLEFFYFLLYTMILLVSLNAIVVEWSNKNRLLLWRANLLPGLLFGPVLSIAVMIVTYVSFLG